MTGDVIQLPLSMISSATAWDRYDQARLEFDALYTQPDSTREQRLEKACEVRRLWTEWATLYDRAAS